MTAGKPWHFQTPATPLLAQVIELKFNNQAFFFDLEGIPRVKKPPKYLAIKTLPSSVPNMTNMRAGGLFRLLHGARISRGMLAFLIFETSLQRQSMVRRSSTSFLVHFRSPAIISFARRSATFMRKAQIRVERESQHAETSGQRPYNGATGPPDCRHPSGSPLGRCRARPGLPFNPRPFRMRKYSRSV